MRSLKKELKLAIVILMLLCGVMAGVFAFVGTRGVINDVRFTKDVVVEAGEAKEPVCSIPFQVNKDGNYVIRTDWTAPMEGVITGFKVRDAKNEIVFCVTGETLQADSVSLELKAGEYRAEFQLLTSTQQLKAYLSEVEITEYSDDIDTYEYATDVAYELEYHFLVEKLGMIESPARAIGVVVGAVVGFILVVIMICLVKKDWNTQKAYDERQLQVRGDGFKYGFFTEISYNTLLCLLYLAEIKIPVANEVMIFFGVILSSTVYAIYCIRKEAYISMNESLARFKIMFGFLGIFNILIGIMLCMHGEMMVDGVLSFRCLNIICGVFLLILTGVLFIQSGNTEKEEDEE